MGSAQIYGFLAASFLVLTLLADSTAACYCHATGLRQIYCTSDVVAWGKFVNATIGDPLWYWGRYDFQITKVLKIPETLQDIKILSLYSKLWGSTCGYRYNGPFNNYEYIITGNLMQNHVIISTCSFIKPIDTLTRTDLRGLLVYPKLCNQKPEN